MDLELKGKSFVVSGGTRGIGRAIADRFAEEGANIAICARNEEQVNDAVEALSAKGVSAYGEVVDIADAASLQGFVRNSAERFGGLNGLVSNASALMQGVDLATWESCLKIDVLGAQRTAEAALPFLKEAADKTGDASIVAVGSVSSVNAGQPDAYGAMKAALVHYMRGLAKSLAPEHVRANVISPGTIYFKGGVWNVIEENMPDIYNGAMARNPMGRMGTPEEIADATVFLSSPRSSFTTGINMLVDGAISDRVNF